MWRRDALPGSECTIILDQTCFCQKDVSTKGCYALSPPFFCTKCVISVPCSMLFFSPFPFFFWSFLSRVQTGVSSLLWRVFIRGICQEAPLPPLLPQWMHSALVGAGKSRRWMFSVMEGFTKKKKKKKFGSFLQEAETLSLSKHSHLQHDTCPICRKSLEGVDHSLLSTPELRAVRSIRTEQQERQATWQLIQVTLFSLFTGDALSTSNPSTFCFLIEMHMHQSPSFIASAQDFYVFLHFIFSTTKGFLKEIFLVPFFVTVLWGGFDPMNWSLLKSQWVPHEFHSIIE